MPKGENPMALCLMIAVRTFAVAAGPLPSASGTNSGFPLRVHFSHVSAKSGT